MEEQLQIKKKDRPLEQDLIVVKIYSPFGDLLAGDYQKVQNAIDVELCNKGITKNVILYGQNNAGGNVYLGYADNSDGPAKTIEHVLLIEYFCGQKDSWAVQNIHQAIKDQYGPPNSANKIKYMIFNNVDMTSLGKVPSGSH